MADPDHLIAVTSSANRSKGARGPDEWKPPDESYWYAYASHWAKIKEAWGLWMSVRIYSGNFKSPPKSFGPFNSPERTGIVMSLR